MKLTYADLKYGVRWVLHILNCVRYAHYLLMVFLSKPGAKHVTAFLCSAIVFGTHYLTSGLPELKANASIESNALALFDWVQYNHDEKKWWILIDVPIASLGLFASLVPQNMLRMTLGMFPAMRRPMRPLRAVKAAKDEFVTVKAKIVVKPLPRPIRRDAAYDLVARLPEHVQLLLRPHLRETLAVPTTPPLPAERKDNEQLT